MTEINPRAHPTVNQHREAVANSSPSEILESKTVACKREREV